MVDPVFIFKSRVCVARFGEMDLAGWWNTKGVLGNVGTSVYKRGFPKTHLLTQAQVACTVAAERCRSVFSPPKCITLWSLPPEIEDSIDTSWPEWCRNVEAWQPFFAEVTSMTHNGLLSSLLKLKLIDNETIESVKRLRRGAEGRGVALPGTGKADRRSLMMLTAAFSKGERASLAVPYLRSDE